MNRSSTPHNGAQRTPGATQAESRRSFLKLSAATVATSLFIESWSATGAGGIQASPPTTPWATELPTEITPIQPSTLDPTPTETANIAAGEVGRAPHLRWNELAVQQTYEVTAVERPDWVFNPAYPPQPIWGFKGNGEATTPGTRVLKFVIDRAPPEQDLSQVPDTLRELRPLDPEEVDAAPVRRWDFERRNGMWAVNRQFFDPMRTSARVRQGTAEIWELANNWR